MRVLFVLLVFLILPGVLAVDIGVNYYHETMMNQGTGSHRYIDRTVLQVHEDMRDIADHTRFIKVYANPLLASNVAWTEKVIDIAHLYGLHVALVMNVEDRKVTPDVFAQYVSSAIEVCKQTDADVFVYGNELSLHEEGLFEPWIFKAFEHIQRECSHPEMVYEAFWWKNYHQRVPSWYNMYEGIYSFTQNVEKLPEAAIVGEFGYQTYQSEEQQASEIQKRLTVLGQNGVERAYIFAYREPSYTGFGIVKESRKTSAWNVLFTT